MKRIYSAKGIYSGKKRDNDETLVFGKMFNAHIYRKVLIFCIQLL